MMNDFVILRMELLLSVFDVVSRSHSIDFYPFPFPDHQAGSFEEDCEYLRSLIHTLPGPHKAMFFALFALLHAISLHKDENLMDASNLAVVIGPAILRVCKGFLLCICECF